MPDKPAGLSSCLTLKERPSDIINVFAYSHEYQERYGHLSTYALLKGLYQQILGRDGEAAGIRFYHEQAQAIGINLDIYSEGNAVHSFIYMQE